MRTNQVVKYTLFVSCYFFWVGSGLMIAVGVYARMSKEASAVDSLITDPSVILITVGILMFAVTFLGCMGALRDLHILLKIFAWLMLLILVLQIVAAVLGFFFSGLVLDKVSYVMGKAISRYREDLDLQNFIDFIQKKFECCGVGSYTDWSQNIYFECRDSNPSLERCAVPYSCCIQEKKQTIFNTMCGYETQSLKSWQAEDRIHVRGCLDKLVTWGKANLLFLAGIAMAFFLLEVLVIFLAKMLIYQINFIVLKRRLTIADPSL
uniref:Tetraspanin n=1 Tax=Geotrypetes seraphini TaxID=260995 RepID=A0A6P8RVD7_GEOSA|nr:tetraspanin-33-like [Geotrypetes seraphini]